MIVQSFALILRDFATINIIYITSFNKGKFLYDLKYVSLNYQDITVVIQMIKQLQLYIYLRL